MTSSQDKNIFKARRLARLAAVQALYQESYEEEKLEQIIGNCMADNFALLQEEDEKDAITPDADLFIRIVEGVAKNTEALDEMLLGSLDERFSLSRMERLLKGVLRSGVYELLHHTDVDASIIISDYIDVTRAFFGDKEPNLVNAVLDKLAKKLR